jgi:hypothetical protein
MTKKHHSVHEIAHMGVHHASHARKARKSGGKAHYEGASMEAPHGKPESAMEGDNEAEMDLKMKNEERTNARHIDGEAEAMGERKRGGRAKRKHGGALHMKKDVGKMHGEHATHHAGRKARKSGGRAASSDQSPFTSARHGVSAHGRHLEPETMD